MARSSLPDGLDAPDADSWNPLAVLEGVEAPGPAAGAADAAACVGAGRGVDVGVVVFGRANARVPKPSWPKPPLFGP
jgi:hypothetical protein